MPDFYHLSDSELLLGTVLERRWYTNDIGQYRLRLLTSALQDGFAHFKTLVLSFGILVDFTKDQGFFTLARECFWEHVRQAEFPAEISRVGAIFVCDDLSQILEFQSEHKKAAHLYTCEVKGAMSEPLDMGWLSTIYPFDPAEKEFEYQLRNARGYWGQEVTEAPTFERLVAGEVKITGVIEQG